MSWTAVADRIASIGSHPRLRRAVRIHTDGILQVREDMRDASKLLAKEERYRAFMIFLMLAAEAEREGRTSVAYRDFYEACTADASISDRTAKTVAGLLVHFRFATARSEEGDRRRRSLLPTLRAKRHRESWSWPAFDALACLDRPYDRAAPESQMLATFAAARTDYCASGLAFFAEDADFARVFAIIEGGSVVCMAAISAAMGGGEPPSRSEIADRFLISRAQVSRVVAEGREAGLFTAAGPIVPSERLLGLYERCEVKVFAFIDVQRELGRDRVTASQERDAASVG